jgi:hypothetical protein
MADRVDGLALFHANQYVHHGVTMSLAPDLVARIGAPGPAFLTYGQAVEYQIIRDQDRAMTAYLADSSGDPGPAAS